MSVPEGISVQAQAAASIDAVDGKNAAAKVAAAIAKVKGKKNEKA